MNFHRIVRLLSSYLLTVFMLLGFSNRAMGQYGLEANPVTGYAPLHVIFSFTSTATVDTITSWYWDFGNGQTSTAADPDTVIYNTPGTYTVSLVFNGRADLTIVKADYIKVFEESQEEVSISNVFTPNGDNTNDNFIVTTKAQEPIRMSIFTRAGILVYKTEGTVLVWDGYTASGQKMNPGIYFYTLEAIGNDPTSAYKKSGFFYMYW
jgi:gliding motility-associated-like protein